MNSRRPLASLAALGLAAALLTTGLAASPAAAATAASTGQKSGRETAQTGSAEVVLSGTIALSDVDEAHPAPAGAAYSLRVENDAFVEVSTVVVESTFSITLPGGENYYLEASVIGDSDWYPVWYGDDTPIPVEAAPLVATTGGLTITLPRSAPVSGSVTADAVAGVATTALEVQAWWYEESSDAFYKLDDDAPAGGAPTTAVPWSLPSVPAGEYVFRSAEDAYPAYDDQYFSKLPRLTEQALTTVPAAGRTGIDFAPKIYGSSVSRLQGGDRYATGVAITKSTFDTVDVLYIASGANWPDALSAGPAAAAQDGALLLTDPIELFDVVAAEIVRLDPKRIVVAGSSLSVSDAVVDDIASLTDATVDRIAGSDRYDTSRRLVADAFPADSYDTVFLATGNAFPDALSVAPIAGRRGEPVLLVDGAKPELDAATRAAIADLDATEGVLLGRAPSISQGIQTGLESSGTVRTVSRIAGVDRNDTSRKLNDAYRPSLLTDTAFLAFGNGFADALAVGPVAAAAGAPLYLSESTCLPATLAPRCRGTTSTTRHCWAAAGPWRRRWSR
ncbi:cell wall-binding repeat-containing protein [Rathayibacter oskolensis]|uniref:cell wall-binding repeat-containing protein n=1 Tax=Rathayibacter oskolensis TaxID=1891671 RepID=UPI00265DB09C|nr:cell wall-binding repeat-containing protein [Rathayibacter oskolensis]WKK73080.1 cell wall-binding repeat-containing protein [Rathayibacter oskolensis]